MNELRGLTALVTGASRGAGCYIAEALAHEGMNLVLTARNPIGLEQLAGRLRAYGSAVTIVAADLSRREDLESLVRQATTANAIDVLVNNAGMICMLPYHRLTIEDIRREIDLNLVAPMLLTRLLLPAMLARKRGHIVNIASLAGEIGLPCEEGYCATKAGLILFSRCLRAEYRREGVSCSAVLPGLIWGTGMVHNIEVKSNLKMSRVTGGCTPERVARAVIRAIRTDAPEIIVNRTPLRPLLALFRLFPRLADPLLRSLGVCGSGEAAAAMNLESGGAFTGVGVSVESGLTHPTGKPREPM